MSVLASLHFVAPAQAGAQVERVLAPETWVPANAGTTNRC